MIKKVEALCPDYNSFDQMDLIYNKWLETNKEYLDKICDELLTTF